MNKKSKRKISYKEVRVGNKFKLVSSEKAELVPLTDGNPGFPCTLDENHEFKALRDDWTKVPPEELTPEEIRYFCPFDAVTQGDCLFVIQETYRGHPRNDRDRKYGFISVNTRSGELKRTAQCYATADLLRSRSGTFYGRFQVSSNYYVYNYDEIKHIGGFGLLDHNLDVLIEPRFDSLEVVQEGKLDLVIVSMSIGEDCRVGLIDIGSGEFVVPCEYDHIEFSRHYIFLVKGWLPCGMTLLPESPIFTKILDFDVKEVATIPYPLAIWSSTTDHFALMSNGLWGRVSIHGEIMVEPEYPEPDDVPDRNYTIEDLPSRVDPERAMVLSADELSGIEKIREDELGVFKYEGTQFGPDGQANLSLRRIGDIQFLSIDPEYDDFHFLIALNDAHSLPKGTVLLKPSSGTVLKSLPRRSKKTANHLLNIIYQLSAFIGGPL